MEKKKDEKKKNTVKGSENIAFRVLTEPWITEEATRLMELNKYVFKVSDRADKAEVKKAIKEVYEVEAVKVNIINIPRKFRIQGRTRGWKSGFKKAIVTLKEGDKIDLYG